MVERYAVEKSEAARVVVVAAALDDLVAKGRRKRPEIEHDVAPPQMRCVGHIELLQGLPTAGPAGFVGMYDPRSISECQRRREAERNALIGRPNEVQLPQAQGGYAVIDVEGTPCVIDTDELARTADGRHSREGRISRPTGRSPVDTVVYVHQPGDGDAAGCGSGGSRRVRRLR